MLIIGNLFIALCILSQTGFLKTYVVPTFVELARGMENDPMILLWGILPLALLLLLIVPVVALIKTSKMKSPDLVGWGIASFITLQLLTWCTLLLISAAIYIPNALRIRML